MLKQAENELLTRVGPGTAMGAVMRRYWIPVLLREEIPDPDGDPVRVRLLGEDLVAFRDSTGAVGLLGASCPHRGAPLFFGRNERSGLRCMYHGWKFTVDGRCTEMPNVPPASDFKARIRHTSYPCVERHGMVWAYLGPERPVPSFPAMDWTDLPPDHLVASKQLLSCNYAQAMEGDFDPSHISFLHSSLAAFRQFEELAAGGERATAPSPDAGGELTPELEHVYWALDPRPVIMAIETENGLFSGARREAGAGHYYYRFNHFIMPFFAGIPRDAGAQAQVNAWVPVDDETTMVWRITYRPERPLTEQERAEQLSGLDAHVAPGGYLPPTAAPGSRWVPALNRADTAPTLTHDEPDPPVPLSSRSCGRTAPAPRGWGPSWTAPRSTWPPATCRSSRCGGCSSASPCRWRLPGPGSVRCPGSRASRPACTSGTCPGNRSPPQ